MSNLNDFVGGGGSGVAANVTVLTTDFDGVLSSADSNVQSALETIDEVNLGGGGVAADVSTNAAVFEKNLSSTDTDVQTALETLDGLNSLSIEVPTAYFDGILEGLPNNLHSCIVQLDNLKASYVPTSTGSFDQILNSTDDTIQKALDTIDEHDHDGDYSEVGHRHDSDYSSVTHTHDSRYLGVADTAVDSYKLNGLSSSAFARTDALTELTQGVRVTEGKALYLGHNSYINRSAADDRTTISCLTGSLYLSRGSTAVVTVNMDLDLLYCIGDITAFSDIRQKEDLEIIPDALDKVSKINGYTFVRTGQGPGRKTGLIAQELEKVLPEAVYEPNEGSDMKAVAYGNVVGLLVEAIKELKEDVDILKAEVSALKD